MTDQYEIPQKNLDAIAYYLSQGGNLALRRAGGLIFRVPLLTMSNPTFPVSFPTAALFMTLKPRQRFLRRT